MRLEMTGFLILVSAVLLILVSLAHVAGGASLKTDVPRSFQVHSSDGRQTIKAECLPKTPDIITCNLIMVEFLPFKQPDPKDLSLEATIKSDPKLASEMKKNPKKAKEQWAREIEKTRNDFCSPSSKDRAVFETKIRDPHTGPKRKKYFQEILDACSSKDPQEFAQRLANGLVSLERTCKLWVNAFSLEFKRIGKGQWFSDRGGPQGMCNVVATYVLKQYEKDEYGLLWTLSETMLAADTTSPMCKEWGVQEEELNKPLIWSWTDYTAFELPSCDFVESTYVSPEPPFDRAR